MMLDLRGIDVAYGAAPVLRGLSLSAAAGQILCLLGRNGAGKTTTMKAIMGLLPPSRGQILLGGRVISGLPAHQVPRLGIGYVPQGRKLFGALSVAENLTIGLMAGRGGPAALAEAMGYFPALEARMRQRADTLSGGEQTMLAVARALCLSPAVLLLDEPTEGLQPSMIAAIRDVVVRLRAKGTAIVLVEQRVDAVLAIADRVAFIENGQVQEVMDAGTLRQRPDLLRARLGV